VQWNGKNDAGESLPSGMYMYKLHAGTYVAMEKLVLLK
jgi:flagellar hook assembly protein FlgD